MVSHDQSAELESCAQEAPLGVVPEFYFGIVVLEVGGNGSSREVAPFAYDGVAEESVVCFVGVSYEYRVGDLAANLAVRSDSGGP